MSGQEITAPEWSSDEWINTRECHELSEFHGKVVMLHAFQMLCPGCVTHALPQAQRVWDTFSHDDVMVVGLHTVFEHHDAMTPTALRAFVHEFRLTFPIAIDRPAKSGGIPLTMNSYGMRGTPTLVLIDQRGMIRHHSFGRIDDLTLGAELASLMADSRSELVSHDKEPGTSQGCSKESCATPA